jgi:hypothetical protein
MIPPLFGKQEVGIWRVKKRVFIHIEHICTFFVTFFSATIDDRDLIFGHKLHIGTPYCGKRFWTSRQTGSRNLTGPKRYPQYGISIWCLWPNIRNRLVSVSVFLQLHLQDQNLIESSCTYALGLKILPPFLWIVMIYWSCSNGVFFIFNNINNVINTYHTDAEFHIVSWRQMMPRGKP